jgi:hypothetical protein
MRGAVRSGIEQGVQVAATSLPNTYASTSMQPIGMAFADRAGARVQGISEFEERTRATHLKGR